MARTTVVKTAVPAPFATDGVAVTWADADTVNDNRVQMTGREIVLARNTGAGAATVTINSVALNGRVGDITADSIAAGAMHCYQLFPMDGWRQTDGYLYLEASSTDIEFAVLVVP
jgi:hypothetical protein